MKRSEIRTEKLRSSKGMTMAEMLITVAIILILAAVGFIALANYQRMLAQTERDGYAKELFIAAQNHLSTARANGYDLTADEVREGTAYGQKAGDSADEDGVYLLVVNEGKVTTGGSSVDINSDGGTGTLLDVMLPFASIDETVRSGSSSYVIRYQPKTGRILDVFYVSRGSSRFDFSHDLLAEGEYSSFMSVANDDSKGARRRYFVDRRNAVLGWYGGDNALGLPENKFKVPSVKVINGDTLRVEVTNPSANESVQGSTLKLIISGKTKNGDNYGKLAVYLKKGKGKPGDSRLADPESAGGGVKYTYTLDDITRSGMHFCELGDVPEVSSNGTGIIAGDDIEVTAVAYSRSIFANVAYSESVTENSLFESIKAFKGTGSVSASGSAQKTASISRIRHLENLDAHLSNAGSAGNKTGSTPKLRVKEALQTRNIEWGAPYSGGIYDFKKGAANPAFYEGFRPISPAALLYDGLRHSISGVPAASDSSGSSGLFGTTAPQTEIRNLRLIDCRANGTQNAGALAGVLMAAKVSNVSAYNSNEDMYKDYVINSSSNGNAGGLAGSMEGGSVIYSSASLRITGGSNAGGFIGRVIAYSSGDASSSAVIRASYSGGHTWGGDYFRGDNNKMPVYNVRASGGGNAGGFIGASSNAKIRYCYSTCSASAGSGESNTASGFIGSAGSSTKVNDSYCTGLTNGRYAFIGSGGFSGQGNYYYSIINEKDSDSLQIEYKDPVSGSYTEQQITALDRDAGTFNSFTGGSWNDAEPYDDTVETFYNGRYSLRTVTQLANKKTDRIEGSASGFGAYFVNTHYGDWPAPEVFIINN